MSDELLSEREIKKNVPKWVLSTGYTLMFLSVFINSIGLNLMQINTALTNNIVTRLEVSDSTSPGNPSTNNNNNNIQEIRTLLENAATKDDIAAILDRLDELEAVAHKPAGK